MQLKIGDRVTDVASTLGKGTIVHTTPASVGVRFDTYNYTSPVEKGGWHFRVLEGVAVLEVESAIALLQGKGYRVEAPYWESKAVMHAGSILGYVDKDSVQVGLNHNKLWFSFAEFDAIVKVVDEAKAFAKEYR